MNNTMYFLRKKNMRYIEQGLIEHFGLELCYKDKKEKILKNNKMLITCKNKYISILVYNYDNKKLAYNIANYMSKY